MWSWKHGLFLIFGYFFENGQILCIFYYKIKEDFPAFTVLNSVPDFSAFMKLKNFCMQEPIIRYFMNYWAITAYSLLKVKAWTFLKYWLFFKNGQILSKFYNEIIEDYPGYLGTKFNIWF